MKKFTNFSFLLISFFLLFSCSNKVTKDKVYNIAPSLINKPVLVGNIPIKFPLVDKPTSLNIATCKYEDVDAEKIYVWNKYEEMTGVNVNWTNIKRSERSKIISNIIINNSLLDLIIRCRIDTKDINNYGTNGFILDLAKNDLLKNNAPNCWAYLQSHPDALASIMNPDGSIYSLPQINSGAELRVLRKLFVNKHWLKKIGMDLPTTTDEFYLMLKAFKEQDANGNGDTTDEIPMSSQDWLSIQEAFFGSFGLANRGCHNMLIDYDEENHKARFIPSSKRYKDFLTYFNKLYSQGLIDEHIFSISLQQWQFYTDNNRLGVFSNTNLATLPSKYANDWVAIEQPLINNTDSIYSAIRANFHSTGAAILPATCSNPELVLQWLDYFWTDEGTLFYHMGIENETFIETKDGKYDYTKDIYNQMKETFSFDDVVALYSPYPGGGNPTVELAPYFKGGEMANIPAKAARELFKYGPKTYWPSFTFTKEETELLNLYLSDLQKYINTTMQNFISGSLSFDSWNDYLQHLKLLKCDQVIQIYQNAINRYEKFIEK